MRFLDADETPGDDAPDAAWAELAAELGLDVVVRATIVVHGTGAEALLESWRPSSVERVQRRDEGPVAEIATQAGALLRATIARVRRRDRRAAAQVEHEVEPRGRAAGRVLLAGHGAIFGALASATLLDTVSTATARVRYPVLLIGAGFGLATALLSHDEWELDGRQAWLVGAAMRWGVAMGFGAGLAIASGSNERLVGGVLGGIVGTIGGGLLVRRRMNGTAIAALDSFAAWGLGFGTAMGAIFRDELGDTMALPAVGGIAVGIGSGIALGRTRVLSLRTLLAIDAGAAGGAAIGAGSALIVADAVGATRDGRTRAMGIALGVGGVLGGVAGALVASATDDDDARDRRSSTTARPNVSVHGDASGGSVPSFGVEGTF